MKSPGLNFVVGQEKADVIGLSGCLAMKQCVLCRKKTSLTWSVGGQFSVVVFGGPFVRLITPSLDEMQYVAVGVAQQTDHLHQRVGMLT